MTRTLIATSLAAILLAGCGESNEETAQTPPPKPPAETKAAEPDSTATAASSADGAAESTTVPIAAPQPEPTPEPTAAAAPPQPDGEALFKRCSSCHGQHAEKSAMNASQVIAGWPADKIVAALQGYKDGSYGGKMRGTMAGQASRLDNREIEALAAYITTLKP
jgi:cytochrome c553